MDKWQAKVAVITGANSGNGFAILAQLAQEGMIVVGLDLQTDQIEKLKLEKENQKIFFEICDITKDEAVAKSFQWINEVLGGVDVLVNNAGILKNIDILDEQENALTELQKIIDVNITGVLRCTRAAYASIKLHGDYGYIININSILGHKVEYFGDLKHSMYTPSKHALTAITEVLRQELFRMKNVKVRVSSISPGLVDTNLQKSCGVNLELKKSNIAALQPSDIADAVIFVLGTPSYVTVTDIQMEPVTTSLLADCLKL